jgi:PHP family Zn ribbon phosphoesterase
MNWRVAELQKVAIVSNSDGHSPKNLGREATVIKCEPSYYEIVNAIKSRDKRLVGTIEFYPQEGKYHYDGHRACNVIFTPEETKKHQGICPVCHRPLTVGVDHRVGELARFPEEYKPQHHKKVEYIIPLREIIAELFGRGKDTKAVNSEYEKAYSILGNEFSILRKINVKDISQQEFPQLAYAVDRMRKRDVKISPGYDGIYGVIQLFDNEVQRKSLNTQMTFDI